MKGPEAYLNGLALRFSEPRGHRAARLDSSLRVWIGHDLFYFADRAARDRFAHDPLSACRALSDPVTQRRFRPTRKSPRLDYSGRPYWFESEATRDTFRTRPDWFANRGPMDEARPMMMNGMPLPH